MRKKSLMPLILLLIAAAFLYIYKLGEIPNGLYVDEAVVGYNAYSILQTGRDEYGAFMPAAFRFFGSYTPPLYVYLTVPFVALFDLSVFSTRILSVFSVLLMIVTIYLFIKKLDIFMSPYTAIIGAILFTITPWTFFYGRVGYEVFLGLSIFSFGALLGYLALAQKKYIIPALIVLSLATYTAHPQKYLVPLFLIGYFILYFKTLLNSSNRKHLIIGIVSALLLQIPNLSFLLSPAFLIKGDLFYIQPIKKYAETFPSFIPDQLAIAIAFLREFSSQYLTYFSPRSLFIAPDPDLQRSLPDLSVFYPWMVIPYFVGLYTLWHLRQHQSAKYLILLLLVAPVPAAITGDPFSTQRGLTALLPLILVIILGADRIIKNWSKKIILPVTIIISLLSLIMLWRSYFILLPLERSQNWSYGFEQLAEVIANNPHNQFIIDQYQIKPAYIELTFFLKYPPALFQQQVDQTIRDNYYTNTKWSSNYNFGNITTRQINRETDLCAGNILVGNLTTFSLEDQHSPNLIQVINIKDPLDNTVFVGYEVQSNEDCQK